MSRVQILHSDGTEESVVLPHVGVRVLDKDSSAEAAARMLLEPMVAAEEDGGGKGDWRASLPVR